MKPNLTQLPAPKVRRETRAFTSIYQPGIEFSFTCKGAEPVQQAAVSERSEAHIKTFVDGDPAKKQEPQRLPLEGLGAVSLSVAQCRTFALAEVIQCPEDSTDKYTLPELVRFSRVAPDACEEFAEWAWSFFNQPYEAPSVAGNADGAALITP